MREGTPSLSVALDAFLDDVGIRRAKLTRRTYELRLRVLREMKEPPDGDSIMPRRADREIAPEDTSPFVSSATDNPADAALQETPLTRRLSANAPVSLAVLTPSRCRQLVADQIQRYAPATVECFAGALKSFVKFCRAEGWMLDDPTAHLAYPHPTPRPHRYLPPTAIQSVIRATKEPNEYLATLLLTTGLRAAEVLSARVEDIDDGLLLVKGKGSKWRYVPLPPEIVPLLPKSGRIVPWHYHTLKYRLQQIGKRAGIPHLHAHLFRHSWASNAVEKHDLATVQIVGGWASDQLLKHYARSTIQKAAARKMLSGDG